MFCFQSTHQGVLSAKERRLGRRHAVLGADPDSRQSFQRRKTRNRFQPKQCVTLGESFHPSEFKGPSCKGQSGPSSIAFYYTNSFKVEKIPLNKMIPQGLVYKLRLKVCTNWWKVQEGSREFLFQARPPPAPASPHQVLLRKAPQGRSVIYLETSDLCLCQTSHATLLEFTLGAEDKGYRYSSFKLWTKSHCKVLFLICICSG